MTAHAHPARWTPSILSTIGPIVDKLRLPVHDPYAGTGERLGRMCDQLGLRYTGTEIEPEWIVDPRVTQGDSTTSDSYPPGRFVVVTSPAYPNGMSDHFAAGDSSRRHTYRQALADMVGHDRPLNRMNMGRYSVRAGRTAERVYWDLAACSVRRWPDWAVVNVSDFVAGGATYPLVDRWTELLERAGYEIVGRVDVATPRQRHGANSHLRAPSEAVIVALWQGTRR